jgi:hypothetical protein
VAEVDVNQQVGGAAFSEVACAEVGGDLHVVAATTGGQIMHTIRFSRWDRGKSSRELRDRSAHYLTVSTTTWAGRCRSRSGRLGCEWVTGDGGGFGNGDDELSCGVAGEEAAERGGGLVETGDDGFVVRELASGP